MVSDGMSEDDILQAYPDLEREDIREALRYAAAAVQERELPSSRVGDVSDRQRAVPRGGGRLARGWP
jgi:hypothetical protein